MLLTTTDTIPYPHTPLGVVEVGFASNPVHKTLQLRYRRTEEVTESSVAWAKEQLADRATKLGADAVIGPRLSKVWGNGCVLMGTAVKLDEVSAPRLDKAAS